MKPLPYSQADYSVPHFNTFPEFVAGMEALYGSRPALSWFTRRKEEKTLTYAQFTQQIKQLSNSLLAKDLPPQSHIAIVGENSADWLITFFAVVSCGHIAVCVDTEQSDDSIRDMIRRSDSRMVFLSTTFLPICLPLFDENQISHMVLMGGMSSDERVETLPDLIEKGGAAAPMDAPTVTADQTAEIIFTSGTTSRSKLVMLSQGGILQNVSDTGPYVRLHERVFSSLPFYHAYGINTAVMNSFIRGCHLYINGDLKTTMRDLQLAKPGSMLTVPLMVEAIHNQIWLTAEKAGKANSLKTLMTVARLCKALHLPIHFKTFDALRAKISDSLELIICGGAHLSREIAEEFELFGIQMLQGYGITECSPLISVNCNYANKLGSVGRPMPSMEVRIEDDEVCVRGPAVMQGYYKNPRETAEVLQDGWFKTGDLGQLDKDGYLYLTGRKKNLIVFKNGKKVSPEKLEELIASIPMVKEVMVSGSANGILADDVKLTASIYPDPQRTVGLSSYEILDHLQREVDKINHDLPSYQQIQLINIREKEFNKTGTKKIKRHDN